MPHNKHELDVRLKMHQLLCISKTQKDDNNNGTCGFANQKRTGQNTSQGRLTCAHLKQHKSLIVTKTYFFVINIISVYYKCKYFIKFDI